MGGIGAETTCTQSVCHNPLGQRSGLRRQNLSALQCGALCEMCVNKISSFVHTFLSVMVMIHHGDGQFTDFV